MQVSRPDIFKEHKRSPKKLWLDKNENMDPLQAAFVKSVCDDINPLMTRIRPSAIINITGGGFRNLERIPHNFTYDIKYEVTQEIFKDIETSFTHKELYSIFNMGIGMMVIVKPKDRHVALSMMNGSKVIGSVRKTLFTSSVIVNGEVVN